MNKAAAAASADREVALRETFKDVLANLIYATTCYELSARMKDAEYSETLKGFLRAADRGRGAYRDIFCADEWRHDREGACRAVGEVLGDAGADVSNELCKAIVEAVMRSMPGGSNEAGKRGANGVASQKGHS